MNTTQAKTLIDNAEDLRAFVRARGDLRRTPYPIHVVGGTHGPRLKGEGSYHTTPSGLTRVRHPNAYGWRTLYHCSTLRIEVSLAWLRRARPRTFGAEVAQRAAEVAS